MYDLVTSVIVNSNWSIDLEQISTASIFLFHGILIGRNIATLTHG